MSKLTDDFIEWALSEYKIHLTAKPSLNGEKFEDLFPELYFLLKQDEENEEQYEHFS